MVTRYVFDLDNLNGELITDDNETQTIGYIVSESEKAKPSKSKKYPNKPPNTISVFCTECGSLANISARKCPYCGTDIHYK